MVVCIYRLSSFIDNGKLINVAYINVIFNFGNSRYSVTNRIIFLRFGYHQMNGPYNSTIIYKSYLFLLVNQCELFKTFL